MKVIDDLFNSTLIRSSVGGADLIVENLESLIADGGTSLLQFVLAAELRVHIGQVVRTLLQDADVALFEHRINDVKDTSGTKLHFPNICSLFSIMLLYFSAEI